MNAIVTYLRGELADAHDELRRLDRCDPDHAVLGARLRGRVQGLADALAEVLARDRGADVCIESPAQRHFDGDACQFGYPSYRI